MGPPVSLSVQYNTNSIPFPSPMAFESYGEHVIENKNNKDKSDKVSVSNPFKKDQIVFVNQSNDSTNPSSNTIMSPSAEQTSTDGHVYFTETTNANVPTIE